MSYLKGRIDECSNLCNESALLQDSNPSCQLSNPLNGQSFCKCSIFQGLLIHQLEPQFKQSSSFILSETISIKNLQKHCKIKIIMDLVHGVLPLKMT